MVSYFGQFPQTFGDSFGILKNSSHLLLGIQYDVMVIMNIFIHILPISKVVYMSKAIARATKNLHLIVIG